MPEYKTVVDNNGVKWNVLHESTGVKVSFDKSNIPAMEVEIPDQLEGCPVVSLADKAFYKNESVRRIKFPATLTVIGEEAFFGCTALEEVDIPENINKIPKWCFAYCSKLSRVGGIDHITVFEAYSFYRSFAASELVLKQEISLIGYYAFSECLIEAVYFGNIIQAGKMSFARCPNLTAAHFVDNATAVPAYCFYGCEKLEYIELSNVTAIGECAFGRCPGIKNLKLPAVISKVGANILLGDRLKCLTVPETYDSFLHGGELEEYKVKPIVTLIFDFNDGTGKKEKRKVYYGERAGSPPSPERKCREVSAWCQTMFQGKVEQEFVGFMSSKIGSWFRTAYEEALEEYDFEKPLYADLTLYAQWRVKEDNEYEAAKLCD